MIKTAKMFCKVDAVKFQKRNNLFWASLKPEIYNRPHPNSHNSFGNTYLEHRQKLEFDIGQHKKLKSFCDEMGIAYECSVWDLDSAREIVPLYPASIKIPSACNNNFRMLDWLCGNYSGEIRVSTGMTTEAEIENIVEFFKDKGRNQDLIIYHCISNYPVDFEDVCLGEISRIKQKYGNSVKEIGFSGHHLGIAIDIAAYVLGAVIIERHFTLDRTWKGSDHAASLEPEGMRKLKRDLMATYKALELKKEDLLGVEIEQLRKLKYPGNQGGQR
jgi:N-acetylneuraminate synthase